MVPNVCSSVPSDQIQTTIIQLSLIVSIGFLCVLLLGVSCPKLTKLLRHHPSVLRIDEVLDPNLLRGGGPEGDSPYTVYVNGWTNCVILPSITLWTCRWHLKICSIVRKRFLRVLAGVLVSTHTRTGRIHRLIFLFLIHGKYLQLVLLSSQARRRNHTEVAFARTRTPRS